MGIYKMATTTKNTNLVVGYTHTDTLTQSHLFPENEHDSIMLVLLMATDGVANRQAQKREKLEK